MLRPRASRLKSCWGPRERRAARDALEFVGHHVVAEQLVLFAGVEAGQRLRRREDRVAAARRNLEVVPTPLFGLGKVMDDKRAVGQPAPGQRTAD